MKLWQKFSMGLSGLILLSASVNAAMQYNVQVTPLTSGAPIGNATGASNMFSADAPDSTATTTASGTSSATATANANTVEQTVAAARSSFVQTYSVNSGS
jgi:hypothetical protein